MPPKPKVTKESIVNAAFEILRKEGIDKINARAVCERLNCSTQPIFWHFKNMEELKDETIRKAKDLYNEYIQTALKEPLPFKAAGLAYIKFAKDEPLLFSLLFMKDNHNINPGGRNTMKTITKFYRLPKVLRDFLKKIQKYCIFTFGFMFTELQRCLPQRQKFLPTNKSAVC